MRMPSEREIEYYRRKYPEGTRIQLDADMDDPQPILAGTKGTILMQVMLMICLPT